MMLPLGLRVRLFAGFLCICFSTVYAAAAPSGAPDSNPSPTSSVPAPKSAVSTLSPETVTLPGPLRSFLRMAGISQSTAPEQVLPYLAHNIYTFGFQSGKPTEFLLLIDRYLRQAGELESIAGASGWIRVPNCESSGPLLEILGYRLRQGCGQRNASLVTSNSDRAFLTIDSGFPLIELEQALQKGTPFSYPFPLTRLPILFKEADWMRVSTENKRDTRNLIELLLKDPVVARLYWAMAQNDPRTAAALERNPGLRRLLPYASILDFYGSQIWIRSGRVMVPGGDAGEAAWKDLAGASPASPGEFVLHLIDKDGGWLAAYFDTLSRIGHVQQAHFTDPARLKSLYGAFRSPDTHSEAAGSSLRPAPGLLVLFTRLRWAPDGEPLIPGNLDVWKEVLRERTDSRIIHDVGRHAGRWNRPEQLLEGMVALSRVQTDTGPLQAYLALAELDSRRPAGQQLSPGTTLLLARKFPELGSWYPIFSEFPDLNETSITRFVSAAETLDEIHNHALRGNALGIFQANIGLWQILVRQGEIPRSQANDSWQKVIDPLTRVPSSAELYDAGCASLRAVLVAATGKPMASQDEILDLLAGPRQETPDGQRIHRELADRERSVLDSQRLVSLDTLLTLGDGLRRMAKGERIAPALIPLAAELREFEMPRPIFTSSEKTRWAPGVYNNRHTELQMRTDLGKILRAPASREQLEEARGQIVPFLRDTLVGLNYAYYEPPGSQILHNNSLFVRSHDFAGETFLGDQQPWQTPQLFNAGTPAGGGAYLAGSLADLPYALATAEQDFIAPENVQALIWKSLVPDLLVSATLPRWWAVSRNELHAVALYQESGEELIRSSAKSGDLRNQTIGILSDRMEPRELDRVDEALAAGDSDSILGQAMPADLFYLAAEFDQRFPDQGASQGPASRELASLNREHPAEISWEHISADFGVPHPILAENYGRELLSVKPFPPFGGNSSRLFAESWDSSNLYWARLADEMGYSPVMLNHLVPELTRRMVAKIFANDFEDWRALLRAMEETGDEFRKGRLNPVEAADTTPH
ncbi:MAG TPA: hypothetical protein VGR96_16165 [Acidobacteriaceae bacterium]|nr:hypothetical protein [Acidobacteriaceae bacterium]